MPVDNIANFPEAPELLEELHPDIIGGCRQEKAQAGVHAADQVLQLQCGDERDAIPEDFVAEMIQVVQPYLQAGDGPVGCVRAPLLQDSADKLHAVPVALDVELIGMEALVEDRLQTGGHLGAELQDGLLCG